MNNAQHRPQPFQPGDMVALKPSNKQWSCNKGIVAQDLPVYGTRYIVDEISYCPASSMWLVRLVRFPYGWRFAANEFVKISDTYISKVDIEKVLQSLQKSIDDGIQATL